MSDNIRISRGLLRNAALGLGLVSLLVFVIALIVTPGGGFTTVSYIALGVAILGIAGFVALDPEAVAAAVTGRSGQYIVSSVLLSVVTVAAVVGLFVLVRALDLAPVDTTEQGRYRLSEESQQIIESIEEPVEAIAFYPTADQGGREEAELWLDAYVRAADGSFEYRFVDPEREPGLAQSLGVEGTAIVLTQGDRTAEVSFPSELNITNAFVQVLIGEARTIYSLVGHGERDIEDFVGQGYATVRQRMERIGFTFETLNLLETGEVPEDASALMILGPRAQISRAEVEAIDAYLQNGGRVLFHAEPTAGAQTTLGSGVLGVAFSPDGDTFASAGTDGTVRVWSIEGPSQELVLRGHAGDVLDVAYSPDGSQIASMSQDGTVRIWDADSGEQLFSLEGHQTGAGRLSYSPDGDLLASVGNDQIARIWETGNYTEQPYSPISVPLQLFGLAFNEDGSLLAGVGGRSTAAQTVDGVVYLWDPTTGEEISSVRLHGQVAFDVAFNPNGETVHSVALDGTEGILDLETLEGSTVTPYETSITALEFDDEGRRIYGLADGTIHIRPEGSTSTDDDTILEGHTDVVWDVGISGDVLVSASADGDVRTWDYPGGRLAGLLVSAHSAENALANYLEEEWGIILGNDLVVDTATQGVAGDIVTPVIFNLGDHPITNPLEEQGTPPVLFTAQSVRQTEIVPQNVVLTDLLLTTAGEGASWAETTDPFATGGGVEFDLGEDIPGPVAVGVSARQTESEARMVVIGDADYASNNLLQDQAFGNEELMVNAVNWLTEGEIDIPSTNFSNPAIDQPLTGPALSVTGIALVCLLPAVLVISGVVVLVTRRRRR